MTIKAIIFDLEGVLMKTKDVDLYTSMANALNAPYEAVRAVFFSEMNDWIDKGNAEQNAFDKYMIETLGLGEEKIPIIQQVHDEMTFIDQVLLTKIKVLKKDYKIGLLTNYSKMMREKIEKDWQIDHLFDAIIISSEVGMIKPDTEIYELMLDKLDVQPREAVMIDDRSRNIEGAESVGMHAVLYKTRDLALADLDALLGIE